MLDNRLYTFLTLCETGNYTRTAEKLNMTQPAVSQHIQVPGGLLSGNIDCR
jgi:DNA-binding transcriptional LysR family regulator